MSARIMDGKAIADALTQDVRVRVDARIANGGSQPALAVVLVGDDPASQIYVRSKRKLTTGASMRSLSFDLPADTSQSELLGLIDRLNADPTVSGILVQLPLPRTIDSAAVTERIDWRKDVDGLCAVNMGRLVLRMPVLRPCTPYGCMTLLKSTGETLAGKHAVVLGQSNMVGRPMALELLLERCTVTICHSATHDLPGVVRGADIVVAALGRPRFVQGDWIKPGAMVVDIGINRDPSGKLCGDVDFEAARAQAGWITPVPGGVGPMTIATLLDNTLKAAELQDEARPG